jgi:hypothetical protein
MGTLLGAFCLALFHLATVVPPPPAVVDAPTIVDVAAGVSPDMVPWLVRLHPDEHVLAVEAQHGYYDLSVASSDGTRRRVLVLMH